MHVGMLQAHAGSSAIDGEVGMDGMEPNNPIVPASQKVKEGGWSPLPVEVMVEELAEGGGGARKSGCADPAGAPCRAGTAPRDGSRTPLSCMERFLVQETAEQIWRGPQQHGSAQCF